MANDEAIAADMGSSAQRDEGAASLKKAEMAYQSVLWLEGLKLQGRLITTAKENAAAHSGTAAASEARALFLQDSAAKAIEAAHEAASQAAEAESMAAQYADEGKAFDSAYYADAAVKIRNQAVDAKEQARLQEEEAADCAKAAQNLRQKESSAREAAVKLAGEIRQLEEIVPLVESSLASEKAGQEQNASMSLIVEQLSAHDTAIRSVVKAAHLSDTLAKQAKELCNQADAKRAAARIKETEATLAQAEAAPRRGAARHRGGSVQQGMHLRGEMYDLQKQAEALEREACKQEEAARQAEADSRQQQVAASHLREAVLASWTAHQLAAGQPRFEDISRMTQDAAALDAQAIELQKEVPFLSHMCRRRLCQAGIAESKASTLQKSGRGGEAIKLLAVAAAAQQKATAAAKTARKLYREADTQKKALQAVHGARLTATKHVSAASRLQELSKAAFLVRKVRNRIAERRKGLLDAPSIPKMAVGDAPAPGGRSDSLSARATSDSLDLPSPVLSERSNSGASFSEPHTTSAGASVDHNGLKMLEAITVSVLAKHWRNKSSAVEPRQPSKIDSEVRKCTAQVSVVEAYAAALKKQAEGASKESEVALTASQYFLAEAEGALRKAVAADELATRLDLERLTDDTSTARAEAGELRGLVEEARQLAGHNRTKADDLNHFASELSRHAANGERSAGLLRMAIGFAKETSTVQRQPSKSSGTLPAGTASPGHVSVNKLHWRQQEGEALERLAAMAVAVNESQRAREDAVEKLQQALQARKRATDKQMRVATLGRSRVAPC
eukprot:jgi/Botrbrau1/14940/Bobra.0018s0044.1